MKERIGNYQIISALSSGGMATIYLGRHAELGRQAVIKQLHPHLANDQGFVKRFEREAKLLGRLHHENIVDVTDYFELEGSYYIILEYIDGCSLKDLLDQQPKLPFLLAVYVVCQIAQGLWHAHQNQIIHRDIKPANIMLTKGGGVKITDFGLAYAQEALGITDPGTFVGTPAYLAPEQIKGQPADAQSDIYALGVMFYEMLSGGNPFAGQTHSETIDRTLRLIPKSLARQDSELPLGVDPVMQKLLDKNPKRRYGDAGKLLAGLVPYQMGSPEALSRYLSAPRNYVPRQEDLTLIKKMARAERRIYVLRQTLLIMALMALLVFLGSWSYRTITGYIASHKADSARVRPDTLNQNPPDTAGPPVSQPTVLVAGTEGARVTVNGRDYGSIPLTINNLNPGLHRLMISKEGFEARRINIRLNAGQSLNLTADLIPQNLAPGFLKLSVKPWAEIYLNGRYYERTPLDNPVKLSPGQYQLILRHPNRREYLSNLVIKPGDTLSLDVTMPEAFGRLRLTVSPWAVVYIDGEEMGTTPLGAPLKLSIGEHELKLSGPLGKEWKENLNIEEDKTLDRNIILQ
ncbi:serine/threonine protein kinase [candidate division TA06 bacterium]|uniref:Serine/threonine protein kinase n=1 Tax=candidate division TA06 bacterium TaxID=2250710 RepID=A0A933IG63_UNCT6|nr:serine/threonine protein kinase [candidate division TA06 bacterium]